MKTKELERHSIPVRILRLATVPLLNLAPSKLIRLLMKKSSKDAGIVVAHGGSTIALEVMYTRHHRDPFERGIIQGIADYFWHHVISQPKALRNRLKIVEYLLMREMKRALSERTASNNHQPIHILNVAGGSSRAVIHALDKLRQTANIAPIRIINIDRDMRAIELGKQIASSHNLAECFTWIADTVWKLESHTANIKFSIIEVVGLLDYYNDEKTVQLLSLLREHLAPGGALIVANVVPNNEMPFVRKTGWPSMYYRTPQMLESLLKKAGFEKPAEIHNEPLHVHAVVCVHL